LIDCGHPAAVTSREKIKAPVKAASDKLAGNRGSDAHDFPPACELSTKGVSMKIALATAVILAALSSSSFAETAGTDALGSDMGSLRLSQKDPTTIEPQHSMAQAVKTEGRKVSVRSYSLTRR
jgi:hypothetical protein